MLGQLVPICKHLSKNFLGKQIVTIGLHIKTTRMPDLVLVEVFREAAP